MDSKAFNRMSLRAATKHLADLEKFDREDRETSRKIDELIRSGKKITYRYEW